MTTSDQPKAGDRHEDCTRKDWMNDLWPGVLAESSCGHPGHPTWLECTGCWTAVTE